MGRLRFLFPILLAGSAGAQPARVTAVEGRVQWAAADQSERPMAIDDALDAGARVRTGEDGRAELRLPDGSALRVGPSSQVTLKTIHFETARRNFLADLLFGKVWASVVKMAASSNESSFEVSSRTAVAGVRGTRFRLEAGSDYSTVIKVYDGEVGVKPVYQTVAPGHGARREVPGPQEIAGPREVDAEEWSRIVGSGQMVLIAADGRAGEPSAFDPEAEASDPWVRWNRERDRAGR